MDKIFSATYSGVDVYEFILPAGSVMRRMSDGWVNATHILKTANFPKAKRTRILERDVQVGEHEKVQGGYGKYQGTWVPLERAKEIAKEFGVSDVLHPLLEVESLFADQPPPPAPKHRHEKSTSVIEKPPSQRKAALARKAASMPVMKDAEEQTRRKGRKKKPKVLVSNPNEGVFVGKRHVQSVNNLDEISVPLNNVDSNVDSSTEMDINDGIESDLDDPSSMNLIAPSSPSEFMSDADLANALKSPSQIMGQPALENRERNLQPTDAFRDDNGKWIDSNAEYTGRLLEYFMQPDDDHPDSKLPDFLIHPPKGLDFDQLIDDEGHTAFHWACAMGNPQVAEILVKLGANYRAVNNFGETPLMKAVQFTNSYTKKTFSRLVSLLSETIFEFDSTHRTVLHHIAASASSKSRVPSALYYMDIVIAKVAESQSAERLESFLNLQDNNGDTVLHLCAKNANRKCIKLLLNCRAKTNIRNNQGLIASDILLENENVTPRVQQRYEMHLRRGRARSISSEPVAEPHISEAAIEATHKVSRILMESLKDLSNAYDHELERKQADADEVKQLLLNMEEDINTIQTQTTEFVGEDLDNDKLSEHVKAIEDQVKRNESLAQKKEARLKRVLERSQKRQLAQLVSKTEKDITTLSTDQLGQAIELTKLQSIRDRLLQEILDLHSGFHRGDGKMQKYRRLISASADVPINDVSDRLDELLNEIENEA
jgi:transcription factor MBP1